MSESESKSHSDIHDEKVARINVLARKSKAEGLTEDEKTEQHELRRWYIDMMKASLTCHLEAITVVDEHGNKRKLRD
jgi:uncharacterized protein YnzC (UPF0291/DUF896 family)